jgi:death on curing protein
MRDVAYLSATDVLALANTFFARLGYAPPILRGGGEDLLGSAVVRAENVAHYAAADLCGQAAALANGIALNHPFLDGNKRTAWIACVTFLALNGHLLPDEAFEPLADQLIAMHETADRSATDDALAAWLRIRLT